MCVNGITAVLALHRHRPWHRYARPSSHPSMDRCVLVFKCIRILTVSKCMLLPSPFFCFFFWDFNFILCAALETWSACTAASVERGSNSQLRSSVLSRQHMPAGHFRVCVCVRALRSDPIPLGRCWVLVVEALGFVAVWIFMMITLVFHHFLFHICFLDDQMLARPLLLRAVIFCCCPCHLCPSNACVRFDTNYFRCRPLCVSRAESTQICVFIMVQSSVFTCHLPFTIRLHAPFLCVFS